MTAAERNPFDELKVRLSDGWIEYFLYQQDGTKQPMSCRDTRSNRIFVSWMQIYDAPPKPPQEPT